MFVDISTLEMFVSFVKIFITLFFTFGGCDGYNRLPQPVYGTNIYTLKMPDEARINKGNKHICTAFKLDVENELYIKNFEVVEMSDRAHQLILHGCSEVPLEANNPYWNCGNHRICAGSQERLFYAWSNNSTNINLPSSIGFRIGDGKKILQYLVVEVQYAETLVVESYDHSVMNVEITNHPPIYTADILKVTGSPVIPAQRGKFNMDVCCPVSLKSPLIIIAASVHSHSLGISISAFAYNSKTGLTTTIIKTEPKLSQAYTPTTQPIQLNNGDLILVRCTYNSSNRVMTTYHGTNDEDEMCNVHVMYYTTTGTKTPSFDTCGYVCGGQTSVFPSVLLPANPVLDIETHRENQYKFNKALIVEPPNEISPSNLKIALSSVKPWKQSDQRWVEPEIYPEFLLPCVKDMQR